MKDVLKIKREYKASPLWLHALAAILVPTIFFVTCEWIHRGTFNTDFFANRLQPHLSAFVLAWITLLILYTTLLFAFNNHLVATVITGLISNVPAVVTYFKLQMRGEPFFPWDIFQIGDFLGVAGKVKLKIQPTMIITAFIFIAICIAVFFIKMPINKEYKFKARISGAVVGAALLLGLFNGVYLNTKATEFIGIYADMWMQDRYYKNHGVITGFLTNLQALQIQKPDNYTESNIKELEQEIINKAKTEKPFFSVMPESNVKTPNIIFLMNESFWDASRLEGIVYDRELVPNLMQMQNEGAYGYCYTPSFGGGTCDVEFEALTGFSLENLPAGSKPYQQHVTKDMFSLPQFLKTELGYKTLAIHGYYGRFWSRNSAYPRLGIDEFIASENFNEPEKRRGYISDMEMTRRIISEMETRKSDSPLFIHAVTMQNHTTYDKSNYHEGELVNIVSAPEGISQQTLDELSDFATGVHQADAALGELVHYLRTINEPTILVFWGDHFNPIGIGYELYEKTGFINEGDNASSPNLHETSLCIWSNYAFKSEDLGTIASYNIAPVTMKLFNLDMPTQFEYLVQQLSVLKARTRGTTVNTDNSKSEELSEAQQESVYKHSLIQYDLMFGDTFLRDYTQKEE